ncbi:hypothetical protein EIZ62_12655 [Streptomyces ficellus]|uniref:Uncharacterized protein n=1 Tax=Streptomyces ficellus TaxID=1977088 RepID=A0A6I6F822_9ACTN|nr:hypothetical protein EIZ62_12655 [Streptomyces ficellus]
MDALPGRVTASRGSGRRGRGSGIAEGTHVGSGAVAERGSETSAERGEVGRRVGRAGPGSAHRNGRGRTRHVGYGAGQGRDHEAEHRPPRGRRCEQGRVGPRPAVRQGRACRQVRRRLGPGRGRRDGRRPARCGRGRCR